MDLAECGTDSSVPFLESHTVDDINPGVPFKGSTRVRLRGSFKGSISL